LREGGAINLLGNTKERVKALMWIIEIQMCLDVLHQVVRSGIELDSLRNFGRSGARKMLFIYSAF
jgi:hypothetical protein